MDSTYSKSNGSAGSKGVKFQIDLLIVFLLNAIRKKIKGWKLSTENKQAGKFDDVVLECDDGAIVLQAKHKDNKKITPEQLNSTNSKRDDFSLPKYFLDYLVIRSRFSVKLMVICTNTRVDSKILNIVNPNNINEDHILYNENGSSCYTFSDSIISDLLKNAKVYYENNSKDVDETLIVEDNAKEFLKHLQFHVGYPSGYDLEKSIEKLLSDLRRFNNLLRDISYRDLHQKIREWFEQPKGEYLTESRTKVLFCEIISEKFLESLENYNVLFKNTSLNITNSEERIFHVVADEGRLLHLMNIYQNLQYSTAKRLYVGSDYNKDVQKEIIRAFQHPGYPFLIFASSEFLKDSEISEISDTLQHILNSGNKKKIIFVVESNNKLVEKMKSSNNDAYYVNDQSLTLENLLENTQEMLMNKKSVVFQGEEVSLANILPEITNDYKTSISSQILEKIVIGEKLIVGTRLVDLEEETSKCYVDRRFEGTELTEIISEEDICKVDENIILISDIAGMGKTTVLKNLAMKIKKNNNRLWVVRIELNQCTNILWDCVINKRRLNLLELLKYNNPIKEATELELFLLSLTGSVVVMLDGVDEISPDYTELILDLLSETKNEKYLKQVFLTTRPHMLKMLEDHLKVKSFKLVPFTEQNQTDLFTKYWMDTLKLNCECIGGCQSYAKILLMKLQYWIKDWGTDIKFASSPLHARMLAMVFSESNSSEEWIGVKEYLQTDEKMPKLPERMNIAKIYQMFIEKEEDIFVKKGNPDRNIIAHSALKKQFHDCLAYHRWLALKTILDYEKCSFFSCYDYKNSDDDEKTALKVGIVQKSNNQLMFIHRTFAEYFVAQSILEELQLQNGNIEFQKLLIDNILWEDKFRVTRRFLDNFLYDAVPLLETDNFKNYMSNVIIDTDRNSIERKKGLIHKQAREGNIEIIGLLLKIIDFEIITTGRSSVDLTTFSEKNNNTLTYLKYVTKRDGLDIKDFFYMMPFQEAATKGYTEMLQLFLQMGVNINSTRGENRLTMLHCAARSGSTNTVKFLIEHGANVNIKDKDGCTPIIYAASNGYYNIVKLLITHGADINIKDKYNNMLIHLATNSKNAEMFELLMNCGVQVNTSLNRFGKSVLHIAVDHIYFPNHHKLIELIIKHVDVNVGDRKGNTALHYAIVNGDSRKIEYLVNHGADIKNVVDEKGRTALQMIDTLNHRFFKEFEMDSVEAEIRCCNEIIDIFVKQGVAANTIKDKEGNMPLYVLNLVHHLNIAELLLDINANINHQADDSKDGNKNRSEDDFHLVRLVLERDDEDVNVANSEENKELECAALKGNFEIAKSVVENGADINATSYGGNKALHFATLGDNCEVVKLLVENGADVNAANNNGNTALHFAVYSSNFDMLKWLLENGANINIPNYKGETALHFAARRDNFIIVEFLLKNGSNINVANNKGETVLHIAARRDKFDIITLLVKNDAHINVSTNKGDTALHFAVDRDNFDAVTFLLENAVDINVANNKGETALHIAVRTNNLDIFILLVESGADMKVANKKGETALHFAVCCHNINIFYVLIESISPDINVPNEKGETALHFATRADSLEIVEVLLENGVDTNVANSKGETALHFAARRNNFDIFNLLVQYGAVINVPNKKGETPLHFAVASNSIDIIEFLLDNGVNINVSNNKGETAFHFAARRDKFNIVTLLAKNGGDITIANNDGETALHFAVYSCNDTTVKLLLGNGVDVNVANNKGETALHIAVRRNYLSTAALLVRNGANINLPNGEGDSALHIAAHREYFDIIALLMRNHADINFRNSKGETALHLAARKRNFNITELILDNRADVNVESHKGETALHFAARADNFDVFKLLVEYGGVINTKNNRGHTPLHFAVRRCYFKIVNLFLGSGADIKVANHKGETALNLSVHKDNFNVDEFLMENGVDIRNANKKDKEALRIAALEDCFEIVRLLVQNDIHRNIVKHGDTNTLDLASERSNYNIVKFLSLNPQ